jgi:hypothetical protein
MMVVGRYPSNANECDVTLTPGGVPQAVPLESRDPFDINGNSRIDVYETSTAPGSPTYFQTAVYGNGANQLSVTATFNTNANFSEVFGGFAEPVGSLTTSSFSWGFDPFFASLDDNEKQVGFVWSGNHRIAGTNCIGSEWTMREMEDLFNLNSFITDPAQRAFLPGQGVALIEIYWQHKLLLNFPIFNPFFTMLGPTSTISVWAAFPMQPADPNITFEIP